LPFRFDRPNPFDPPRSISPRFLGRRCYDRRFAFSPLHCAERQEQKLDKRDVPEATEASSTAASRRGNGNGKASRKHGK